MVTVTHAFHVNIADNPTAASAGEVLPSHWNANHVVSGARTALTANINYYISATGSDSNGGTNATTDAWATLQHAMSFIAANLDIAGFTVTVNVGSGSFAGFGYVSCVGGGTVQFIGNGVANTTITAGPNDGVLNFGDCVDIEVISDTGLYIDAVTFSISTGLSAMEVDVFNPNCGFGKLSVLGGIGVTAKFPVGGGASAIIVDAPGAFFNLFAPLTLDGTAGGTQAQAVLIKEAALFIQLALLIFTGTPAFSVATAVAGTFGLLFADQDGTSGAATGKRFLVSGGGAIFGGTPGQLGPSYFPGNLDGTVSDIFSTYDLFPGPVPGINTQTSNYILALSDSGLTVEMNLAGANTVTIPTNASVPFLMGTKIRVVQIGAGATTIAAAGGVTVHNAGALTGQWAEAQLYKRGTDEWVQVNT